MADSYEFLRKLEGSQTLLNVLMAFEDYLDSMDIYAFKNWFGGEVIEGPIIERYWVTIALKYEREEMPDPQGGMRILKSGGKIKFIKAQQELFLEDDTDIVSSVDNQTSSRAHKNAKPEYKDIWVVIIRLPRRFVEDVIDADLEEFEEYLDMSDLDDVSDARDKGITQNSAFKDSEDSTEELDTEDDMEEDNV